MKPSDDVVMDPTASPRTPGSGVRRVNNLPMFLLVGVVALFLLVVSYVAVGRARKRSRRRRPSATV
jgi:type IV secretion system protein VirB10